MKNAKISNIDGAFLAFLAVMTNTLTVLPGVDIGVVWPSGLIAGALALLSAFLISVCCDRFSDEEIYNVIRSSVGKASAAIVGAILLVLVLLSFVVSLTVFSRFVQITALPQTPQIILPIILSFLAAMSAHGGMQTACGAARLLFWFVVAVFILFLGFGITELSVPLLVPKSESTKDIFAAAGEIFLNRFSLVPALFVIYTKMENKKSRRKVFLGSIGFASLVIAAISAVCVCMLGKSGARADFYPVYTAMSLFSFGGFIQHTEIFACIAMTLCLFFKGAVCLSFSGEMLDGIFGIQGGRGVFVPLALITAYSTQLIYRDISSLRGLLGWKSGAIYVLLIYLLIPPLLFVASYRKNKKTG